jgi:hypothetical protein
MTHLEMQQIWINKVAALRGAQRMLESDDAIVSVTIFGGEVVTRESAARRIETLEYCIEHSADH